jgi:hypothetical protein
MKLSGISHEMPAHDREISHGHVRHDREISHGHVVHAHVISRCHIAHDRDISRGRVDNNPVCQEDLSKNTVRYLASPLGLKFV